MLNNATSTFILRAFTFFFVWLHIFSFRLEVLTFLRQMRPFVFTFQCNWVPNFWKTEAGWWVHLCQFLGWNFFILPGGFSHPTRSLIKEVIFWNFFSAKSLANLPMILRSWSTNIFNIRLVFLLSLFSLSRHQLCLLLLLWRCNRDISFSSFFVLLINTTRYHYWVRQDTIHTMRFIEILTTMCSWSP